MEHIAILAPHQHVLEKIISGEKNIETRWYKNRIAPWGNIFIDDPIFFKNAGKPVTAKATVKKVIQLEITNPNTTLEYISQFKNHLGFSESAWESSNWLTNKRYGILVWIDNISTITPFRINKKGFGSACAWLTVPHIKPLIVA